MAVEDGTSQFGHYYAPAAAVVSPLFRLSAIPMLVGSFDEAEILLRIARPYYEAALARHDQVLLATQPWRPGTLWSRQPLRSSDDIAGKVFAVGMNARGWGEPLKRLGARAEQGDPAIVVVAGYTGNLDRYARSYPNVSEIFYGVQLNFLTMNCHAFEALSESERNALKVAGSETEVKEWRFNRELLAKDHADMALRAVSVTYPAPAALTASLRSAAGPDAQAWATEVGAEGTEILATYLRAVGRS